VRGKYCKENRIPPTPRKNLSRKKNRRKRKIRADKHLVLRKNEGSQEMEEGKPKDSDHLEAK